jgi:hypothetical protein
MAAADAKLEAFEAGIGLPKAGLSEELAGEAQRYLALGAKERAKLTPDDCAEACLVLSQYAAHIGRVCQQEEGRAALAGELTNRSVVARLDQEKGYAFDERRLKAVAGSTHATELDRGRLESLVRFKRLLFLAQRIEKVAEAYKGLAYVRRRNNENGG